MGFEPPDVVDRASSDAASDDLFQLEALTGLDNYQDWILANFIPYLGGRTIEYGAGIGTISEKLLPHVASLDLVEPLEPLARRLRAAFEGHDGVRISQATVENSTRSTAEAEYDAAVMVNVLEHIEDDRGALLELHRVLKAGGALCLFVPALPFLYSAFDRLAGHYRRYELRGLKRLVAGAGFEIARAHYFDALGIVPWLVTMRVARQVNINAGAARLYDSLAVPVGRAIETLIPAPIGKNIVLVARKSMCP